MSHSLHPPDHHHAPPVPARPSRPGPAVIVAVLMTWLGAAAMLLAGLMFVFGTRDGEFLGTPTKELGLAGATLPIEWGRGVGAVLSVTGVVLVVLAFLALRGSTVARIGLTVLGGITVVIQLHSAFTGDLVSAWPPLSWIVVAVILLWVGRPTRTRPAAIREG